MKKSLKHLALGVIPLASLFMLTSCGEAQVKTYGVSFEGIYGDSFVRVQEGDHLTEPERKDIEGKDFFGWYYGDKKWSFSTDIVTSDMILTPKWGYKDCIVSFPDGTKKTVQYNNNISLPSGDWDKYLGYRNVKTNEIYEFGSSLTITDDIILELAPIKSSIEFDLNGGIFSGKIDSVYNMGETINLPNLTKKGYEFIGWKNSKGELFENKYTLNNENEKLTAVFKVNIPFEYEFALDKYGNYNYVIITKYTGTSYSLIVPEYIEGVKVKEIAAGAFSEAIYTGELTLPVGVVLNNNSLKGLKKLNTLRLGGSTLYGKKVLDIFGANEVTDLPEEFKRVVITSFEGYETRYINNFFSQSGTDFKVSLDGSIHELPKNAFFGCNGIKELDLSNIEGEIPDSACSNCKNLKSVIFYNNITSIGDSAFSNCESLERNNLPDNLEYIGNYAFSHCGKVSFTEINSKYIGDRAFENDNLTNVRIEGAEFIGYYAFANNHTLESLSLKNVKRVDFGAFYDCENLIDVYLSKVDEISSVFRCDEVYPKRKVQCDSLEDWCNIKFLYTFGNPFAFGLLDESLPNYFRNGEDLYIPKNIETIGSYSFYGLEINELIIPENVKFIGEDAFSSTTINTVVLPLNASIIDNPFYNASITNLCLPYEDDYVYNDYSEILKATDATVYYFTSNNVNETRSGNWWYFEYDAIKHENKVVLVTI